jgi:predicted glutamine amidotransferase
MCELFAMSSRQPTTITLSLEAFSRHGGLEGPHKDGWGIAHYVDRDVQLVRDAAPAADSACVRFIEAHPFSTRIAISHIRKATRGGNTLANCQPFARELGGRMHVFAHNGDLNDATMRARFPLGRFRPVGETDSEYAFCALLERLAPLWFADAPPSLEARRAIVAEFAAQVRPLGPFNFLYADGDALFVHGHRRTHGHEIRPPGLWVLERQCIEPSTAFAAAGLALAHDEIQDVVLVASVPLTSESGWRALAEGELAVARDGAFV